MSKVCVLKVKFSGSAETYGYLAPEDFDVEKFPFVVVSPGTSEQHETHTFHAGDFSVGEVVKKMDVIDDTYDDKYTFIVAGFNTTDFKEFMAKATRRKKLLNQLDAMSKKASQLDTLKRLLAGNAEAEELLKELEALDR